MTLCTSVALQFNLVAVQWVTAFTLLPFIALHSEHHAINKDLQLFCVWISAGIIYTFIFIYDVLQDLFQDLKNLLHAG